jgi:2-keto-4-pentenoate hydratase/2-oxohepta-3-ene-1,7-dioic acid hydratase in catechol pathway
MMFLMPNYRFQDYSKQAHIGKIICLARTYKEHAEEMNTAVTKDPLLFLKPDSSVIFNNGTILIPPRSRCLHHEVELGIVIGYDGKHIESDKAMDYVLGYLVALDITARDLQSEAKKNGWPWTIAKGFDTFAPLSDVILKEKIQKPAALDLELKVNGVIKQKANTRQMIYSLEKIISFTSDIMTLNRGDLILTGTPEGVGEIKEGDILEARLDTYCTLKVDVQKEE